MVEEQLIPRGIASKKVIDAFLRVPRHLFVPGEYRDEAYADHPLPIGCGQTISQPLHSGDHDGAPGPEGGFQGA